MIMMTWVIRVAWVTWMTKAIRVLGLTSQSVSHPISTHRLWKWKCQQYGYYVLNIILLKIFHQRVYCSLMRCHAWNAILWGGCCGRLKGKKLPKKVSTKTPKKLSRWVALNYALWFQHRSDRTDVSDDEDWGIWLGFPPSIENEIWLCLLVILWQRKMEESRSDCWSESKTAGTRYLFLMIGTKHLMHSLMNDISNIAKGTTDPGVDCFDQ